MNLAGDGSLADQWLRQDFVNTVVVQQSLDYLLTVSDIRSIPIEWK